MSKVAFSLIVYLSNLLDSIFFDTDSEPPTCQHVKGRIERLVFDHRYTKAVYVLIEGMAEHFVIPANEFYEHAVLSASGDLIEFDYCIDADGDSSMINFINHSLRERRETLDKQKQQ